MPFKAEFIELSVVTQFEFVLKGRGFSRAVSAVKSIAALQFAEKLAFGLAFGWRSGLPLR
ncbi:MAG: hypothetical protein WCF61_19915 [Terriglobales bacterium]